MGLLAALFTVFVASSCFWDGDGAKPPATPGPTASSSPQASPAASPSAVASPPPVSADVGSARLLYREGRYGEARAAFSELAVRTSDASERAEALLGVGNAAFLLNDTEAGLQSYRQAVAAAPVTSHVAVRAHYLLLRHLNNVGQFEEAAALFNANPGFASGSPLEPYYRFEGGRARGWPGGNDIWASLLADPAGSAALKTTVRRELVDQWRTRGDAAQLATALDALIADTGESGARFERAELALEAGDTVTAAAQLGAVIAGDPGSRYAALALELADAQGIAVDPGAAGLSLYRRGDYLQAVETLVPAVEAAATAGELAFRAYYLAASYEDLGRGDDAIRYYDLAAASGGSSPFVHRAKYWAARVAEWSGTPAEASQRYVSLTTSGPAGEFSQEAAFRAGFVLLEAGDGAGALAAWAGTVSASSARLEYWRGRALAEAGDVTGAKAAYEAAVAFGPFELHGLEAARELGRGVAFDPSYRERNLQQKTEWGAIAAWLAERIGGGPLASAPTAACELMASGLREAAASEIWAAEARGGTWRSLELMREASECGLTDVAARLAVRIRSEAGVASHEAPKDLLRVSYPVDYAATVVNEARKGDIDPLFFASLIRQESFWDPTAGSPAGAWGLTQVIQPTGEALADELGVEGFRLAMLLQPAVSLEFGAHYLGGQIGRYGNPLVALAAYNAGPGNASRWAMSGAKDPADLVEVIDFVETRSYVTYIFEAYAHYRLAWGDSAEVRP
jgi:soluble lytic murein transglycosylase